jgi:hypothetical protein
MGPPHRMKLGSILVICVLCLPPPPPPHPTPHPFNHRDRHCLTPYLGSGGWEPNPYLVLIMRMHTNPVSGLISFTSGPIARIVESMRLYLRKGLDPPSLSLILCGRQFEAAEDRMWSRCA